MHRPILSLLLLYLLCPACKPVQEAQETVREGTAKTLSQIDRAKVLSDLTQVTAALSNYRLQHEGYPNSLKELGLSLNHPEDLIYDAKTGQVRSKTFPDL